jgi:hypothetical protein
MKKPVKPILAVCLPSGLFFKVPRLPDAEVVEWRPEMSYLNQQK